MTIGLPPYQSEAPTRFGWSLWLPFGRQKPGARNRNSASGEVQFGCHVARAQTFIRARGDLRTPPRHSLDSEVRSARSEWHKRFSKSAAPLVITVRGHGGLPTFTLHGPTDLTVDVADPTTSVNPVSAQLVDASTQTVVLEFPVTRGGLYAVEPDAESPPITVTYAQGLTRVKLDVHVTGNTVIDALLQTVRERYRFRTEALAALDPSSRVILITTHRRESFGAPLRETCAAIRELSERFPDVEFVLPVHPNPEVKGTVEPLLQGLPRMHLIEPVDYVEFVHLMARSTLILTDSGGIQEEAPSLGKPVLVLREVTERPEGVAAGTAAVVGTRRDRIVSRASELLSDPESYGRMANATNPYGDGRAGERIADVLAGRFS
jgi:hypothetical protein